MRCIRDAADAAAVTVGGKIVVEFLLKTIYNEKAVRHEPVSWSWRTVLRKGRTGSCRKEKSKSLLWWGRFF